MCNFVKPGQNRGGEFGVSTLTLLDVAAIAALLGPLYAIFIWLATSFHNINREIGELTKDVQRNSEEIGRLARICEDLAKKGK